MITKTITEIRSLVKEKRGQGMSIGFVPTMGYLHEGHLSLIRKAKEENEFVVVSVFVNPTQFAPNEDFESYPRDIDRDYKLAVSAGADVVFNPEVEEMYVSGMSTSVIVEGDITKKLCGKSRPTHFKGVTSVVTMLFYIVKADKAYFGQKDAQQAIIIRKMVRDLHMDTEVIVCPIVREEDGLAMSSRNIYLNEVQRQQALVLSQSLKIFEEAYLAGEKNVVTLIGLVKGHIETASEANIDYIEVLSGDDLSDIEEISGSALLALAVKFGKTRLIDNCLVGQ